MFLSHPMFIYLPDFENIASQFMKFSHSRTNSIIREGDVINILGARLENGMLLVDDQQGQIVVNPDFLISGTTVVSSLFCMRK